MNDYKELISSLRRHPDYKTVLNDRPKAADAIEQLVLERDAAVADLKAKNSCDSCKHYSEDGWCMKNYCNFGESWQWRGVEVEE